MPLSAGRKLGSYEIVAPIGAGGMGEVWRARDAKLDRDVAIKVLPASLAADPERVARFEREAKLLASIDHPNIAVIHGFDETSSSQGGAPGAPLRYLVMEVVEGETLAVRLERGPMMPAEALEIGRQIAEALEAAHAKGVIHRDLKPGNVMIRADGVVKVLDFGLAKEIVPPTSGPTNLESPTFTAEFTTPGVVLGTAAYMSPEQARGRPLDKRTDIWSFGVILFECLTGSRLFAGESAHDSLGAILHKEPDWSTLPPGTPPVVQLLLRRCLTKTRKRRLHDIADARVEIEEAIHDPTSSSLGLAAAAVAEKSKGGSRKLVVAAAAAGLLLGAALVAGVWMTRQAPEAPAEPRRFEIARDYEPRNVAISPDGKIVAFSSGNDLLLRELGTLGTRLLWTHDGADDTTIQGMVWSPDSTELAVVAGRELLRIPITSGQPVELVQSMGIFPAGWSDDGYIYMISYIEGADMRRIPEHGGEVEIAVAAQEDELHFHGASVLPDGRGYLTVPHANADTANAIVAHAPDGTRAVVWKADVALSDPVYASTGHVLFQRSKDPEGIWAVPFSLERLEATGEAFLVSAHPGGYSVSRTGDLVYSKNSGGGRGGAEIVRVDRAGNPIGERVGPIFDGASDFALSPDGRRFAVPARAIDGGRASDDLDIWVVDTDRDFTARTIAEPEQQRSPRWMPDGERIAYVTATGLTSQGVYVRRADGSGERERVADDMFEFTLSDDGATIVGMVGKIPKDVWIAAQDVGDDDSRWDVVRGEQWHFSPVLRPGGGLLVYSKGNPMEQSSLTYLRRFPEGEGVWQVSMNQSSKARWNRTGDRLYFLERFDTTARMMELSVRLDGGRVELGRPQMLFSTDRAGLLDFQVSDDAGFWVLRAARADEAEETDEGIVVVENWFEEFR